MNGWRAPGYTEVGELGSGGGGCVVLALHEATSAPVAIKYLSDELRADPEFLREFRAEAQLLGGLTTPYVVSLYEYVEGPRGAAIVMELVDGVALRALLRQEGATGPEAALVVLKGSLLGLAAAHRTGVVHRDYKPENVLVAADGSSKLVDFGIALRSGTVGAVAGTPAYMAPEQWYGRPASPAADVYAATATFHECLTGRKPFRGGNLAELAVQHIEAPVPVEEVPEAVRPLLLRGMAKDPAQRPADAEAFVAELEVIAGAVYGSDWEEQGRRRLAALAALVPLLLPSAGREAGTADLATTVVRGGAGRSRRGVFAAAGAVAVAGLLTLAAVASGEPPRRTTANWTGETTTATPHGSSAAPGPTAPSGSGPSPVSTSPSPSQPQSASPSSAGATADITPNAPGATTWPTPTTTASATVSVPVTTAPPASPESPPPPSATPPVSVSEVSVTSFAQTGAFSAAATIALRTGDTRSVTVTVTWYSSDAEGERGTTDGTQTFTHSGSTSYSFTVEHIFPRSGGCWFGALATTDPAAAGGPSFRQILTRQCVVT